MIVNESVDSLSGCIAPVSQFAKGWQANWVEKRAKVDEVATAWLPWFRGEENAKWDPDTAPQPKL